MLLEFFASGWIAFILLAVLFAGDKPVVHGSLIGAVVCMIGVFICWGVQK